MQCVIKTLLYGKNLRKNHYNQKKNSSAVIDNEEISNKSHTINMYNKCGLYLTWQKYKIMYACKIQAATTSLN